MCQGFYWEPECPGSVATAIGAAFQTQGMYVMADIVYQFTASGMEIWAPVLYVMAAMSGLIMMAMGQPPKLYLWFFIGPAIYNWSLFNTVSVQGTAWNVAGEPQDQEEVWKLAEIGLLNTNLVALNAFTTDDFGSGFGIQGTNIDAENGPQGRIFVPGLFVWWDTLISGEMQNLSSWTGIYSQQKNTTNQKKTGTHETPTVTSPGNTSTGVGDAWHILSNSKWPMLENVTAASVHNQDLREAFVVFLSSECGDELFKGIDESAYISAAQAKGKQLPKSVFTDDSIRAGADAYEDFVNVTIPAPISYLNLIKGDVTGGNPNNKSFARFLSNQIGTTDQAIFDGRFRYVSCGQYFYTLVQGFRWEAANVYNQIVREASDFNVTEDEVVFNFIYGWRVAELDADLQPTGNFNSLATPEQKQFVKNMVLLHLFRNEIAFAQNPINERWSESERSIDYTEAYQRTVGSKSKYGELYTWAKMMPYIQGVLLYLLAIAYPFCCVVMVIPGWWKTLFTWMAFWAWAKSWDLGFAIVQTLERSIWAMVGNHQDAATINGRIHNMRNFGQMNVDCGAGGLGCPQPDITSPTAQTMDQAIQTFDFGLLMAGNLDLDLANSYYIYLMSALYFAVPAVTGQVLLGAKAGASSMVNTAVGGVAAETGKNAGAGFTGATATKAHNNFATMGQANFAKSMRSGEGSEFLKQAYGSRNSALSHGLGQSSMQAFGGAMRDAQGVVSDNAAHDNATMGVMTSVTSAANGVTSTAANNRPRRVNGSSAAQPANNGVQSGQNSGAGSSIPGGTSTGAGASQGSGTAPAGPPGVLDQVNNALGGRAATGLASLGHGVAGVGAANFQRNQTAEVGRQNEALRRNSAGANVAGFGHGAMANGHNMMAGRYESAAQQAAGEEQWRAMRNVSAQFAGKASAMGVFAGAFVAGPKPMQVDGMAGTGQLGSGRQSDFNFANPNNSSGYGGQVSRATGWLDQNTGSGAGIWSFRPASFGDVAGAAATNNHNLGRNHNNFTRAPGLSSSGQAVGLGSQARGQVGELNTHSAGRPWRP